jgi:hypothetical protein
MEEYLQKRTNLSNLVPFIDVNILKMLIMDWEILRTI